MTPRPVASPRDIARGLQTGDLGWGTGDPSRKLGWRTGETGWLRRSLLKTGVGAASRRKGAF